MTVTAYTTYYPEGAGLSSFNAEMIIEEFTHASPWHGLPSVSLAGQPTWQQKKCIIYLSCKSSFCHANQAIVALLLLFALEGGGGGVEGGPLFPVFFWWLLSLFCSASTLKWEEIGTFCPTEILQLIQIFITIPTPLHSFKSFNPNESSLLLTSTWF